MIPYLQLQPIPPEAERLRMEVRAFLDEALAGMPAVTRARSWVNFSPEFSRALAQRGWVGMNLPREYGGQAQGAFARFVVVEELLARGAPVFAHWVADRQSGPLILKYGTPEQRAFYLPRICRADAFFCIGMSEPQSGSDLASIRTRAVRTEEGWRLNGQKLWTSYAHHAHYMIALVRSSGQPSDRHQGLSQLIVDLSLPGIRIRPVHDLAGDAGFNEVFFDDVLLPHDALVGEEGGGWAQVTAELAYERSGPERLYSSIAILDAWLAHLRQHGGAEHAALLGRIVSQLAVLRAMSVAVTAMLARGDSPATHAALVKDLGTTLEQDMPQLIADALGATPQATWSDDLRRTLAYVLQISPTYSLRGGTREILRGMIARGLGLR